MKTFYSLIVIAIGMSFGIAAPAQAETILQISVVEPMAQDSPLTAQVHALWVLERTGQSSVTGYYNPTVTLKNGLGAYKTPTTLNNELKTELLEFMDTSYGVTSFNAVYLQGGFSGIF